MVTIESFFGFENASTQALRLARIMLILMPVANFVFTLSTTFYTIFVAEALGGGDFMQGLGLLGSLLVVQLVIQTICDYPSGAIGDWIGQRYVITLGNICYGIVFIMVSFVNSSTSFAYLLLMYGIWGFGVSQVSGAWGAWFDNNYRYAMPQDEDRKKYGVFWGKLGMVSMIVSTVALIPGSLLAAIWGRPWVFQLQGFGAFIFAAMVMHYVKDFPEVEALREERPSLSEYVNILKEGVSFLWSNAFVKYVIIGSMLAASTISVWGQLILFPLYFSYLLTDVAVASYRTLLFLPGVAANERSGVWSQKFKPKKWIPRFRLIQACGFVFYLIIAIMMAIFPPAANGGALIRVFLPFTSIELIRIPEANIIPIMILPILFAISLFFGGFADVLTQRVLIDVIPDKIRNSVYSLSPTILVLFLIPQVGILGWLVPIIGFPGILTICALVSLVGVIIIRHGLNQPVSKIAVESISEEKEETEEFPDSIETLVSPIVPIHNEAEAEESQAAPLTTLIEEQE